MNKRKNIMNKNNTVGLLKNADPKVLSVAKRVAEELELEIYKVVAHSAEPTNFPLPQEPNSIEQTLYKRFKTLTPTQKQQAVAKVLPRLRASKAQWEKRFGDLSKVDIHSALPIARQAKNLPLPSKVTLLSGTGLPILTMDDSSGSVTPVNELQSLQLFLHEVKAIDETGGNWWTERGSDEIYLGATTVDESGDTEQISAFKVGDFDDGDVKTFSPPKLFASFDLREGTEYPKDYFVTLVLAEKDQGGLPDFINELFNQIKAKITEYLQSKGPKGLIIALAINYVLGKAFEWFKDIWEDDIFPPNTVTVGIKASTYRFDGGTTESPEAIATFKAHDGTYTVTYSWRLVVTDPVITR
jgi:hypothetical protein